MSRKQVTIVCRPGTLYHLETPNGVVNVLCGLSDTRGRSVDSIQVTPERFAGENKVVLRGRHNTRLVRLKTVKVRNGY